MKHKHRQPVLDQYKRLWLSKDTYGKLRKLKTKQKKSMTQIAFDLIAREYKRIFK